MQEFAMDAITIIVLAITLTAISVFLGFQAIVVAGFSVTWWYLIKTDVRLRK